MADKHYFVKWEIDIFADTPEEAAQIAFEAMQAPTTATMFTVKQVGSRGKPKVIDVMLLTNSLESVE